MEMAKDLSSGNAFENDKPQRILRQDRRVKSACSNSDECSTIKELRFSIISTIGRTRSNNRCNHVVNRFLLTTYSKNRSRL